MTTFAEWLLSIFTVLGVGASLYFLIVNSKKKTKVDSSKFAFDLSKRFLETPFINISREIGQEIEKGIPFLIKDEQGKNDLLNYLSELEIVSQFYLDSVLTDKQTYEILGNQLLEAFSIGLIRNFIDEQRKIPNQEDLFDNLQKVWKKIFEYQQFKIKKEKIQSVESLYKETLPRKNISDQGNTQQDSEHKSSPV